MTAPATPRAKRPPSLTGKQRKHLRGLAHGLEPVVFVGKEGLTAEVGVATDAALETHELIKVRVLEASPTDRDAVAPALADAVGAHHVGTIGRIVILYRRHPSEPKIPLRS